MDHRQAQAAKQIQVVCRVARVPVCHVAKGETWSFSATGQWSNGWITCGPDGYRNFLNDLLQNDPRAAGQPWLCLIGEVSGFPESAFRIGGGCTRTFEISGELDVYANDTTDGYGDNHGEVTLRYCEGGVAPAFAEDLGFVGAWCRFRDVFTRTKGISIIATFVLGICWILVGMTQGRDLARAIGEDDFRQLPTGAWQVFFALGLSALALEAWSWSRFIIVSNYGRDRNKWRPKLLLVWTPRVLGVFPFVGALWSLFENPADNTGLVVALLVLGLSFCVFVYVRNDRFVASGKFARFRRRWTQGSLAAAALAAVLATFWPVQVGIFVGAPGIVFIGLALLIPVVVIAIQIGSSMRLPVVSGALVLAVAFGLWVDNHAIGRRAFGVATTGPVDQRLTLREAYDKWKAAQVASPDGRMTMVLVAAQGGASRAGYWTAVALSALRERALGAKVALDSHIFAITSVSGGSVGAVGYAAMLQTGVERHDFTLRLQRFAGRDALGPALTGMLFPDLVQRFLPIPLLPDRAETLERSWEDAWAESAPPGQASTAMEKPFLELAPQAGGPWRPILIVQGASEDSGRRVLTSGVKFTSDEVDADDLLARLGHDVASSTAILNGARFPWISPGGTFSYADDQQATLGTTTRNIADAGKAAAVRFSDHVLDGGYFDAAGSQTLRDLVRAIRAETGDSDKLHIIFVLIGYSDAEKGQAWPSLATNDVFAPLFGLFAGLPAHEDQLARDLKELDQTQLGDDDPYVSHFGSDDVDYAALVLCKGEITKDTQRIEEYEPPMNWNLSGLAKRYIENAVLENNPACKAKANVKVMDAIVQRLAR